MSAFLDMREETPVGGPRITGLRFSLARVADGPTSDTRTRRCETAPRLRWIAFCARAEGHDRLWSALAPVVIAPANESEREGPTGAVSVLCHAAHDVRDRWASAAEQGGRVNRYLGELMVASAGRHYCRRLDLTALFWRPMYRSDLETGKREDAALLHHKLGLDPRRRRPVVIPLVEQTPHSAPEEADATKPLESLPPLRRNRHPSPVESEEH